MVYINPFSGKKNATKYWDKIESVLNLASVEIVDKIVTEASDHCRDHVQDYDISKIDTFIVLGGDGIVNELVNGIMKRKDWKDVVKKPIGVIPCGTGNALSTTLRCPCPLSSTMAIIQGITHPLDLLAFYQPIYGTKKWKLVRYGFEGLLWGLVSDIDFESESMRFLGDGRFTVGALRRISSLRHYPTQIRYMNDEIIEDSSSMTKDQFKLKRLAKGLKSKINFDPISDDDIPDNWEVHDTVLVYFVACNITHIATDIKAAPHAKLNDGKIDLVFSNESISKRKIMGQFVDGSLESGEYVNSKSMEYIKTNAFLLVPKGKDTLINIDGERVECDPTLTESFQGILTVYLPKWDQTIEI